jgi:hypothetical protein
MCARDAVQMGGAFSRWSDRWPQKHGDQGRSPSQWRCRPWCSQSWRAHRRARGSEAECRDSQVCVGPHARFPRSRCLDRRGTHSMCLEQVELRRRFRSTFGRALWFSFAGRAILLRPGCQRGRGGFKLAHPWPKEIRGLVHRTREPVVIVLGIENDDHPLFLSWSVEARHHRMHRR